MSFSTIKTIYCQTAEETIASAFDPLTGHFLYPRKCIEVPKEQYERVLEGVKHKILQGNVFDEHGLAIIDPQEAANLVKSGHLTYQQARNIALAGNIDALIFSSTSNVISCDCVCGISFAAAFAKHFWDGASTDIATRRALEEIRQLDENSFVTSMLITGILVSKLLQTKKAATASKVVMRAGSRAFANTGLNKRVLNQLTTTFLGRAAAGTGTMAASHLPKLFRSNIVTSIAMAAVAAIPDLYRVVLAKSISWQQFAKNVSINVCCVIGGICGWFAGVDAGAAGAAVYGRDIFIVVLETEISVFGVIGGIIGTLGLGAIALKSSKALANKIIEDDSKKMETILRDALAQLAFEYMLSEKEVVRLVEAVKATVNAAWLRKMYASENREKFVWSFFEPVCATIIRERACVCVPSLP